MKELVKDLYDLLEWEQFNPPIGHFNESSPSKVCYQFLYFTKFNTVLIIHSVKQFKKYIFYVYNFLLVYLLFRKQHTKKTNTPALKNVFKNL